MGMGDAYIGLGSDFRTTRYIEFPFKEDKDLDALPYIFPLENAVDEEYIVNDYKK